MSDSAPAMPDHPPVTDWVHDFDHTDPRWTENPFPIWDEMRAASPVVHTDRFHGCYLPTTYEAVREIAHDTKHFSSRRVVVRDERPEVTRNAAPPITSDPPEHKPATQLLLPPFTPDAMKKLEPRVRAICNELIDEFINDGRCDAAARYAKHLPVRTIAHLLGIRQLVLAVNKMDLVDYDQSVFEAIVADYREFADAIGVGLPVTVLRNGAMVDVIASPVELTEG